MKIYSMTATFGKLENQTLELKPGLNIIHAPNEWGKSTWCAFLAIMLYGLETREKTTKTSLAAKERYAPWSGSPMSGRIDLNWNGRDITIERWSKGRTPLGEFRAYETATGMAVEELTGVNCGQMLLGVERGVFLRSGYLRLNDLPVTEDEALRRRLNALVTTGDESGAADLLAQKLKDLKNKCRSNRANGLIPQAETEKAELENRLTELSAAQNQQQAILERQKQLKAEVAALENHQKALQYVAAQENIRKVEQAHVSAKVAEKAFVNAKEVCTGLPSRETTVAQMNMHTQLLQQQNQLMNELSLLSQVPQPPHVPKRYQGMDPDDAICQAEDDASDFDYLTQQKYFTAKHGVIFGVAAAILIIFGLWVGNPWCWGGVVVSIASLVLGFALYYFDAKKRNRRELEELKARYSGIPADCWVEDAKRYAEDQRQYSYTQETAIAQRRNIQQKIEKTERNLNALVGGLSNHDFLQRCNEIIAAHDALLNARKEYQRLSAHAEAMAAMAKPVEKPTMPDDLHYSEAETQRMLDENRRELQMLQQRQGQCQGKMESLGTESILLSQLDAVNARLDKLHKTYQALELALATLEKATAELQRRFAPRIAQRAQELFGKLTGGRYDRLQLQQDLSVNAAAEGETVLHAAQWRSEGTIDQLYFALRLAVAKELTPEAPLILDDALVRFDDVRHAAAMDILRQEAAEKQIILFTCQSRENAAS